jgi:hypothetical protein
MNSRSTGTRGRYLLAIVDSFGPAVWIRPTALSVKSDALMTLAHGLAGRLAGWQRRARGTAHAHDGRGCRQGW